jgi:Flp pilus assembly pilin Flp
MLEYLRRRHVKGWLQLTVEQRGVTVLEYGLIAALIALVCFSAAATLGISVSNTILAGGSGL